MIKVWQSPTEDCKFMPNLEHHSGDQKKYTTYQEI